MYIRLLSLTFKVALQQDSSKGKEGNGALDRVMSPNAPLIPDSAEGFTGSKGIVAGTLPESKPPPDTGTSPI
jgi:hypothetical protein